MANVDDTMSGIKGADYKDCFERLCRVVGEKTQFWSLNSYPTTYLGTLYNLPGLQFSYF